MAVNETKILFEGFLHKRKDRMRVKWVTYWFRLQNTTLFFYTKNGNALNLRGNYYIYTVQSVQEVYKTNSKRFMFEINMNNGKKKLLAAETVELRHRWVGHLWQAMHLSRSWAYTSSITPQDVCEEQPQTKESGATERLPLSASADHPRHGIGTPPCPTNPTEAHVYKNNQPASDCPNEVSVDPLYDVLPLREGRCEVQTDQESPYDVPFSNRMAPPHPVATENIYDVPSLLLRRIPDHALAVGPEEQQKEEAYWRI